MSNNTRLAELMNYITVDTTSGVELQVSGRVKQSAVTSAILKASSTGVLVAATAGTDYLTSVGISNLTATGTPSATTYLRGDNTWATITTGIAWGAITGTLSSQTDLQTALNAKESTITAGTTAQYWRGDKSWQTLNTSAVPESTNLYYTDARARAAISAGTGLSYNSSTGAITFSTSTVATWAATPSSANLAAAITDETGSGSLVFATAPTLSAVVIDGANPYIDFSNGSTVTNAAGRVWYNGTNGTWNMGMGGGNITQQVGEELFKYGKASAAISDTNLQIIYKTGTVGASGVITFAPTVAGITNGDLILGVATETIAANGTGRITTFGVVHGINTSGTPYGETWADGDVIWYNPVTGNPTNVKPVAPNIKVSLGIVISAGSGGSGSFDVEVNHGSTLGGTDGNVQFSSIASGDLIRYNGTYWTNIAQLANSNLVNSSITIQGTSVSLGGSINVINGTGFVKASGTTISYDNSAYITLISLSATTPLSYNNTTGAFTIQVANTTQAGYLTSADWNTFNGKQGAITLTTTGSSGAATFATNTLNIPNYTLAGLGGQPLATNLTSLAALTYASASFVKMTASGTFSLDTNTYASTSALASYLPLAGGTMTGQIVSTAGEAFKMTNGSGYISGWNAAGTTRQGYLQWTNGNAYLAAEASSNLVLTTQGSNRLLINPSGDVTVYGNSYFGGTINTSATQAIKMNADSCYIGGFNTAGTTRYGYLQFASGALNLISEAGAGLNLGANSTTRIYVTPSGNTGMGTTNPLSLLHLYGGALTVNSSGTSEIGGGMRIISHTKRTVGSTKFIKIYAGTNNYFTGFIYGMNFDDYPVGSATSTGSGFSYQFGGYSDGSGSHGDKFFDMLHFGGNNVGLVGREMNTDGNGYIITALTSTGAGGFKCSATIMLFARDMSQVVISYY